MIKDEYREEVLRESDGKRGNISHTILYPNQLI